MFAKIAGYLWMALGIICAAKPALLRNWLSGRTNWRLFWALLFIFIVVFLQLLGIALRFEGVLPKVVGIIGIVLLLRAAWKAQSKARGRLSAWFGQMPLWPFQAFGWYLIAIGVWLHYFGAFPRA